MNFKKLKQLIAYKVMDIAMTQKSLMRLEMTFFNIREDHPQFEPTVRAIYGFIMWAEKHNVADNKILSTIIHDYAEYNQNRDKPWYSPRSASYAEYCPENEENTPWNHFRDDIAKRFRELGKQFSAKSKMGEIVGIDAEKFEELDKRIMEEADSRTEYIARISETSDRPEIFIVRIANMGFQDGINKGLFL